MPEGINCDNMNQGAAKSEFELLLRDVWELYF